MPRELAEHLDELRKLANDHGGILNVYDKMRRTVSPMTTVPRPLDMHNILALDPLHAIGKATAGIAKSLRSQKMWELVAGAGDEVFSRTHKSGWFPIGEIDKAAAEAIEKVAPRLIDEKTGKAIVGGWVSPDMYAELVRTYAHVTDPVTHSAIGRVYDALTRKFKWAVTRPFVPYHVRNMLEDIVRIAIGDPSVFAPSKVGAFVKNMYNATRGRGTVDIAGAAMDMPDAVRMASAYGVIAGEIRASSMSNVYRNLPGKGVSKAAKHPFAGLGAGIDHVGTSLEDGRRFAAWVSYMDNGMSPYQAKLTVDKVLFDYATLTPFERQTMTRVIPFYSYLKNSIRLSAETAFSNPALINAQQGLMKRLGPKNQDEAPDWVRSRFMIALDPNERTDAERVMSLFGLPWADANSLLDTSGGFKPWVKDLTFRMNPYVKAAWQGSEYFGENATTRPVRAPGLFAGLPDGAKETIGYHEVKGRDGKIQSRIDPMWDYLLNTVFTRAYSTAKSMRMPDPNTTGQTVVDQAIGLTTGIRAYEYDPAVVKLRKQSAANRDLLDAAARRGDLGIFSTAYRTEESDMSRFEVKQMLRERERIGRLLRAAQDRR
jgi:hypothetical protein